MLIKTKPSRLERGLRRALAALTEFAVQFPVSTSGSSLQSTRYPLLASNSTYHMHKLKKKNLHWDGVKKCLMGNSTRSANMRTWVWIPSIRIKTGRVAAGAYCHPSIRGQRQANPQSSLASQPSWNYRSPSKEAGSYRGKHNPTSCSGLQMSMCGPVWSHARMHSTHKILH